MVSTKAKIEEKFMRGIYHFKIHDVFYHRSCALTGVTRGQEPSYAQLYFNDVDTAVNIRMRKENNSKCMPSLMHELAVQLNEVNPFVRSFYTMKEYCERSDNIEREVYMLITVNRNLDLRVYNDATATDVAVIFGTVDGQPPADRNLVIFPKQKWK